MNPTVVIFSVLFSGSAILCVVLALAWLQFGRARHLATWSFAYAAGALQWVINAYGILIDPGHRLPPILASAMAVVASLLVVIGARQRAGLRVRGLPMAAGAVLLVVAVVVAYFAPPYTGLRGALTNLLVAMVFPFAVLAIRPKGRRARPHERTLIAALIILIVYQLALGLFGLMIERNGEIVGLALYRGLLGVGMPVIQIGTGIAAIFLVAGDLAEELRRLAARDQLTGSLNRRGLEDAAAAAIAAARRHARSLSVAIGDIDRFKMVNDRFGHAAGDRVLTQFADGVQASVREEDMLGRIGGDEFCLLLPDSGPDAAYEVVERLRREIAAMKLDEAPDLALSVSFGVAGLTPEDTFFSDLLQRADRALYDAKAAGRDRTVLAG